MLSRALWQGRAGQGQTLLRQPWRTLPIQTNLFLNWECCKDSQCHTGI